MQSVAAAVPPSPRTAMLLKHFQNMAKGTDDTLKLAYNDFSTEWRAHQAISNFISSNHNNWFVADHEEDAIVNDRLLDPTHAEVDVQLQYFSKTHGTIKFSLVKSDGEWKISKGKLLKESNENTTVAKANKSPETFESIIKISDGREFLDSAPIKDLLTKLMGGDYEKFLNCTQYFNDMKRHGTQRFLCGDVHLMTNYMEFFLFVDLATKQCVAGYLGDGINVYGARSEAEFPPDVSSWIKDLKSRAGYPIEVHFKVASPIVQKAKAPIPKNLNTTTWTGTYKFEEDRFIEGRLRIQQLPGNKITFQIQSGNGGGTCDANGTVIVQGNDAIFRDSEGKITFHRKGGLIEVDQKDKGVGRCGMGVSLDGSYKKIDDKPPKFDKL